MSTAKANSAKPTVKWLSCSEIIRVQEATREARSGPQPWILRKLTVGFVFLIIAWATYVYIGRVCLRMIRREDGVVGSRGLGITFLVLFSLLWFILTWSYAKIVITPPGFARDHLPKSPRPGPPTFDTPPPRRRDSPNMSYSQQTTPSYPPKFRTRKPSDWSFSDEGWNPEGLPDPSTYAMARESPRDIQSCISGERDRDPGAGREPSLSTRDSAAAAQSTGGKELVIAEVGVEDPEGNSGRKEDSTNVRWPSTADSRKLTSSPSPRRSNSATRSSPAATPMSPVSDHRPSTGSNPYPHPHHPSHSITSALSMQTASTLIHQESMDNRGIDATDTDADHDEADQNGDPKERGNGSSPAPSQYSRELRKSVSSRAKSPPPPVLPERANQDESIAEVLADGTLPSSSATPRASQHQSEQGDSFQPVNGRHAPTGEAMGMHSEDDLPPPLYSRRPPTVRVLDTEFRYCSRDELVKPYRTHHCRTCGTCVLYYDHHCPWIGQCVGARNRKFFVNFLIWCVAFTTYLFATLLPIVVITGNRTLVGGDLIDGQVVGVMIASIVFLLFSSSLLGTHVHLLMHNASTVEWYGFQRMRQRERLLLGEMFPPCVGGPCGDRRDHPFGEYHETAHTDDKGGSNNWCCHPNASAYKDKRHTRKAWDAEWGKIGKEGNLWWVDASPDDPHSQHISGKRRQWEEVMGRSVWEWLLPIGDTKQKGLDYRPNPRFDAYGRWRKRREWPADLR